MGRMPSIKPGKLEGSVWMGLSIGKAWDESCGIFSRDGTLLMTVAAATVLLPQAVSSLVSPANAGGAAGAAAAEPTTLGTLTGLITTMIALIGSLAVTSIALRSGQTVGDALRHASRTLLSMVGVALVIGVPLFIALTFIIAYGVGGSTPEEMIANLKTMNPGAAFAILIWAVVALYLSLRLMVTAPVALSETRNVLAIIKRSWALTRGHALRLLGYALLIGLVVLLLSSLADLLGGLLSKLLFGDPEPMTMSALVIGLFAGAASAITVLLSAVMSARIYTQLATPVSVPSVEH